MASLIAEDLRLEDRAEGESEVEDCQEMKKEEEDESEVEDC